MRPLPQPVPPPSSARGQFDDDEDDDDEGRTVVRGAPKIVKRTNAAAKSSMPPASISPAAVIKATLESARANRRELLPGPPADLLEDRSDFERSEPPGFDRKDQLEFDRDRNEQPESRKESPFERSAPIRSNQQPAAFARTLPASAFENPPGPRPPLEGPPSYPPPAHYGQSHLGAKPVNAPYGASPQVIPPAPASVPAHFMTPQAPYSDPPGTAVTNNSRVVGRPAISWAAALLACGLFVGVAAVAVMQSSESVADTTASFVDPSRAPRSNSAQQQQQAAAPPTPVPVTPAGVPVAETNPAGLIGASPVAPPPVAPPAAPPADPAAQAPVAPVAAPVATAPVVTAPAVAAPVATAPVVTAPAASPQGTVVGGFAPVTVPAAAPAPQTAPPKKPAWTWRPPPPAPAKPVAKPAAEEEPKKATKAAAEKPSKKGSSDADDETRKALEALQKAQLESASSFGKD